jgi:hypothetical protein
MRLCSVLVALACFAVLLSSACAPGVTIDGKQTHLVNDGDVNSEGREAQPAASTGQDTRASEQSGRASIRARDASLLDRLKRRDAIVIDPDTEPVKGASIGTLLHVDPPHASLPGLR